MFQDHQREYSSYCPTSETVTDYHQTFSSCSRKTMKRSSSNDKKNNKRRFSDEQIKSLESIFESESRLEPRKKLELATELGLQPRQVAIWFQNKRARWKSKQLERDYSILLANYDSLASRFEALKKEKQSLVLQLQKLNSDLMKRPQSPEPNGIDRESDNEKKAESESEVKPSPSSLAKSEHVLGDLSDEEEGSMKAEYKFGLLPEAEEAELLSMNMTEPADSTSLTSPEEWGSLHSDTLFNESSSGYQWWDFWS